MKQSEIRTICRDGAAGACSGERLHGSAGEQCMAVYFFQLSVACARLVRRLVVPFVLQLVAKAADALSIGDGVTRRVRKAFACLHSDTRSLLCLSLSVACHALTRLPRSTSDCLEKQ